MIGYQCNACECSFVLPTLNYSFEENGQMVIISSNNPSFDAQAYVNLCGWPSCPECGSDDITDLENYEV